jgi:hypothetical protein
MSASRQFSEPTLTPETWREALFRVPICVLVHKLFWMPETRASLTCRRRSPQEGRGRIQKQIKMVIRQQSILIMLIVADTFYSPFCEAMMCD